MSPDSNSGRLRIGLLTPGFAGITAVDSGIAVHFRHLAEGLAAAGHSVEVVVVAASHPPPAARVVPPMVRLVVPQPPPAARLLGRASWQLHQWLTVRAAMQAAREACRGMAVDVWETSSTGSLALPFIRERRRPPVVVRVSTTAAQLRSTNAGRRTWIDRRIEEWEDATVRSADRVITHSRTHRDAIAREFNLAADGIPIVPHGIPIPPRPTRTATRNKCEVLFLGRFERRKGVDLLIDAIPGLLAAAPYAEVTLVGADPNGFWQRKWAEAAAPDWRGRVHFKGVIAAEELAACFRTADVFVAPSRYESFGLIFVEAMAQALPVVALNAPGACDVIEPGRTGVLVGESAGELAAALIALARDPAGRLRLGSAGRQVVEQRYSLPRLVAESIDLYQSTRTAGAVAGRLATP